MELIIHAAETGWPDAQDVEVVERKGIGHPDTICDALAEEICRALCHAYLDRFGVVLHHNVDKILLRGGAARPSFGGGEVLEPIEFCLAGRVTEEHRGARIPVDDIAVEACQKWLRTNIPALDVERHVKLMPKFRPGSGELRALFSRGGNGALANDTSCGAGFAPLTTLERIVLETERTLNSGAVKQSHPVIGQDVKVMGVRRDSRIDLTIGCAMIGYHLACIQDYIQAKTVAQELALATARKLTELEVKATVNAADDTSRGEAFITVTGTSAEAGDDGQVGRGNRVSGLITPYRRMTLEAAAGKNPINHVGKIYNLAASRIAEKAVSKVPGIAGASCVLVSQIGRRIDDPELVDMHLVSNANPEALREPIKDVIRNELQRFDQLQADLLARCVSVY